MALTFAETHNMIAYLTKSDASEGLDQIIDFLNASSIQKAWNEFSSSMASAIICLSIGRKFNFLKYIFDSHVRNVDRSSKFYMYPRFLQLIIRAQVGDLSSHTIKYSSPALTQKVFANMRRVGKGFSGVNTPLFEGMWVQQQAANDVDDVVTDDVAADDVPATDAEPTPPLPTPTTTPPPPQELPSTSQGRLEESQAKVYHIDLKHDDKVLTYARELKAELNKNINWDDVIEQYKLVSAVQIVKTISIKVSTVMYKLRFLQKDPYGKVLENNKPHYKIIRANGTHQLFLSFLSLLRKFDKEDLEMLWQIVQERFASSKPKNFSDDFLLTILKAMFEKPDVKAQMILLVERRYPLTRFTLDQMLNNMTLEVEEESEVSLELLRFIRRQQQEGQ
nr:hypothetical protein [Tanacetum cinerariifolium]